MSNVEASSPQLTRLLRAWGDGDSSALELLTPIVYSELHRIARRRMLSERPDHVLQPSALVNEVFVRLMDGAPVQLRDRTHFFSLSSKLMRQILVDFARNQKAAKRGDGLVHVDLSAAEELPASPQIHDFLDLDVALRELASLNERQASVVELRYFGGLENREVAGILGVSDDTVMRDWRIARAWLLARLKHGGIQRPAPASEQPALAQSDSQQTSRCEDPA